MATLPGATTRVEETATALAGGTKLIALITPCVSYADYVPRVFGSGQAIYETHGMCPAVEYGAKHAELTKQPMLVIGIPIATAGAIGREDTSGNSGTCVTSLAAGSDGVLFEHDGVLTAVTSGTVGTDPIVWDLSLDGGRTTRRIRLKASESTITIPYMNVTMTLTAGTIVAGDVVHVWHGSGPRGDSTGWAAARAALAAQQQLVRSVYVFGDVQNSTEALALQTQIDAFETSNDRFAFLRCDLYDRLPQAELSSVVRRASGAFTVTFGDTDPDTIVRSAGSFVADNFGSGDIVTVAGSTSNDGALSYPIDTVAALTLTCDLSETLTAEAGATGVSLTAEASITFDSGTKTIVRAGGVPGSWLDDGFYEGTITVSGSVSNDGTYTATSVTADTITVTEALSNEVIGSTSVNITEGQTKAAWMAALDTAFEAVDDAPRISLGVGRGRAYSAFTGWYFRFPAGWHTSWREYKHDVHVAPWRKGEGPCGADLLDAVGNLVEWDDRVDGAAASAARFTSLRSWANGPRGGFVALSLTRAVDASLLSRTHNLAVINIAQQVCQTYGEDAVGESLVLKDDGTATAASRSLIDSAVNAGLKENLLTNKEGEGQRCSAASFEMASDDVLNVPEPPVNGTCVVNLRGTIHRFAIVIRVSSGGQ